MVMLDLFTGGALSNFSVFALGIMPYITASIIMQLMQGVIPAVGRWAKEGETGRRRITQVTRYLTLGLGLINAIGYLFLFKSEAYGVVFSTAVPEIVTDIYVATHEESDGYYVVIPNLEEAAIAELQNPCLEVEVEYFDGAVSKKKYSFFPNEKNEYGFLDGLIVSECS